MTFHLHITYSENTLHMTSELILVSTTHPPPWNNTRMAGSAGMSAGVYTYTGTPPGKQMGVMSTYIHIIYVS